MTHFESPPSAFLKATTNESSTPRILAKINTTEPELATLEVGRRFTAALSPVKMRTDVQRLS